MKKFFTAIIALMMTLSASAQFYIYLTSGDVLLADSISVVAPFELTIPDGVLPGEFSISETTKVHFSRGNLQYVGTWQFAERQWEYFGNSQADNHRDLFGWGTGDAPNKVSTNNDDYSTFTDWGTNAITNGGNEANFWRTLTKDEWLYLFLDRPNAATLFALGNVNGVNGTILLPDDWTLPAGVEFTASTTKGLERPASCYRDDDANNNHFTDNTYNVVQWRKMEAAGAVFLPAAGRDGVSGIGSVGYYWTPTPWVAGWCYLNFNSNSLYPFLYEPTRWSGQSVRLVH